MRVVLSLFADYALAHEGDRKLYVIGGGIRRLDFPVFPATQSRLALALGIEISPEELNKPHTLLIERFTPQEGGVAESAVKPVQVTFTLPATGDPSEPGYLHFVSNMDNVAFPIPGEYRFSVKIDDTHVHDAALSVGQSGGPLPADALLMDGYRAFETGDKERAEAIFRDVVARFPSASGAHNNLGFVQLARGDARAALESFIRASDIGYQYPEINLANIGAALYLSGDYSAALNAFESCLHRQIFRTTGMLFGVEPTGLFPVPLVAAADFVALMALNAAWSALRINDWKRATHYRDTARVSDMATGDDDRARRVRASVDALSATLDRTNGTRDVDTRPTRPPRI